MRMIRMRMRMRKMRIKMRMRKMRTCVQGVLDAAESTHMSCVSSVGLCFHFGGVLTRNKCDHFWKQPLNFKL